MQLFSILYWHPLCIFCSIPVAYEWSCVFFFHLLCMKCWGRMIEYAVLPARCIKVKYFVFCLASRDYVISNYVIGFKCLWLWWSIGCPFNFFYDLSGVILTAFVYYSNWIFCTWFKWDIFFAAQYNTAVSLTVPGGIRHLNLTVLATWLVLSLYANPSHKISISCPFAQWFGNGGLS